MLGVIARGGAILLKNVYNISFVFYDYSTA